MTSLIDSASSDHQAMKNENGVEKIEGDLTVGCEVLESGEGETML
jgi:hypothetical protein